MWGPLFQAWARSWVQNELHEQFARAVESPDAAELPNASTGCHVGVLAATETEIGPLIDRLGDRVSLAGNGFQVTCGLLEQRRVALMTTGVGGEQAARGIAAMLAGHRPQWVISAGFGGGLQATVAAGELILADAVLGPNGERLSIAMRGSPSAPAGVVIHRGTIYSAAEALQTAAAKQAAGERFAALVTDLETYPIARDAYDEEPARDLRSLMQPQSTARRVGRLLGGLWRRPGLGRDLWNLQERAWLCSDRLAAGLQALIRLLPAASE
jgi:adenosylhomocysteine nucleosidase